MPREKEKITMHTDQDDSPRHTMAGSRVKTYEAYAGRKHIWTLVMVELLLVAVAVAGIGYIFTQVERIGAGQSIVPLQPTRQGVATSTSKSAAGQITELPLFTANTSPAGITAGPDGNLWFTESGHIVRISPLGITTEFPVPTASTTLGGDTSGPDGKVWFTESLGDKIARITPGSAFITEFPIPTANSSPADITAGPDGNLWFTESLGNKIARITPAGKVTEFPVPTANSSPAGITAGPDGNLWFTEKAIGAIGQITSGL
jgi:streptogramin lyase